MASTGLFCDQNPKLVQCWHPDNEKRPHQVSLMSGKFIKFTCEVCNHVFEVKPNAVKQQGSWCPFCASKRLCPFDENCATCFGKSCASNARIAACWSDENEDYPSQVFISSNKKYKFNCDQCPHSFVSTINNLTSEANLCWCPYCGLKKLCPASENCATCIAKSCASHPQMLAAWHKDNPLSPSEVFLGSNTKYKFTCEVCNLDFTSDPNHVMRPRWCPHCTNKTEKKMYQYFLTLEKKCIKEWSAPFFTEKKYRFDFYFPEFKLICELDGDHHFRIVNNWGCPVEKREVDLHKMKLANENGISVIRLIQEDVLCDRFDWQSIIKSHLFKAQNVPTNTLYCRSHQYELLIEQNNKNINEKMDNLILCRPPPNPADPAPQPPDLS